MAISKYDVRRYVSVKTDIQIKETNKKIQVLVNAFVKEVEPTLFKDCDFTKLTKKASELHDLYDVILVKLNLNTWQYKNALSNLNDMVDMKDSMVRRLSSQVSSEVINPEYYKVAPYTKYDSEELINGMPKLITKVKPLRDKLADIYKLRGEIENVIKNAHSGKRAYTDLDKLGIDMSGLTVEVSNLPAIVKLSVDPCLINGGCK
jgi:hypothetical protein